MWKTNEEEQGTLHCGRSKQKKGVLQTMEDYKWVSQTVADQNGVLQTTEEYRIGYCRLWKSVE